MKYPVGTTFKKVGRKNQDNWTVVDYLVTTNLEGKVVQERYVAFLILNEQHVVDRDVCATTIARGLQASG